MTSSIVFTSKETYRKEHPLISWSINNVVPFVRIDFRQLGQNISAHLFMLEAVVSEPELLELTKQTNTHTSSLHNI